MSYIVAVIGDSMLDRYIYGEVDRISPEAPVPVVRITHEALSPGGAAHVACSVQALNQPTVLFTAVGPDAEGRKLLFGLDIMNVSCNYLEMVNWETTTKSRIVVNKTTQVLRYDKEFPIDQADNYDALNDKIVSSFSSILPEVRAIIVSDYNKKTLSDETIKQIQSIKKENKHIPLFVDAKPETITKWTEADCITPNFNEASKILRKVFEPSHNPAMNDKLCESMAKELCDLMPNLSLAVITRAQHGCSWYCKSDNSFGSLPAFASCKSDVIGAGDTFIAALTVAVAENKNVPEAINFANAASALAVSKTGTTVVYRMELDAYLNQEKTGKSKTKIMTQPAAISWARQLRNSGERVVFANGCFDLLHAGHVHLLEQAKFAGDHLLVGLNDDSSVKSLKGEGRPVVPVADRARVLAALECVDAVVVFSQPELEPLIEAIIPDVLVKGAEYAGKEVPGAAWVEKFGGRVLFADMKAGSSTTNIVTKVCKQN